MVPNKILINVKQKKCGRKLMMDKRAKSITDTINMRATTGYKIEKF